MAYTGFRFPYSTSGCSEDYAEVGQPATLDFEQTSFKIELRVDGDLAETVSRIYPCSISPSDMLRAQFLAILRLLPDEPAYRKSLFTRHEKVAIHG